MDEENPSLSSHLGSEGHQCDTVSGSSCKKDPGLWVVSTFPLTLALLRVLEMHSKGYLFASCLKLSNNLLIKEDWKHSTSDLAIWGLQGPCCPRTALWREPSAGGGGWGALLEGWLRWEEYWEGHLGTQFKLCMRRGKSPKPIS